MDRNELRRHCLWLYGVIVGLAMREALTHVAADGLKFSGGPALPALRTALVLLVITRFYLGAGVVFRQLRTDETVPGKNDGLDLLAGLLHFVLFFFWATTVTLPTSVTWSLAISPYLLCMASVLLYDVVWWLMYVFRKEKPENLSRWARINAGTLIASVTLYVASMNLGASQTTAEEVAFLPIAFVSVLDLAELVSKRPVLDTWIRWVLLVPVRSRIRAIMKHA